MNNGYWLEQWKPIEFDFEFTNKMRLEVSNWGRVRSFNKFSNGNILNCILTGGYRFVRLKLFKPKDPKVEAAVLAAQKEISALFADRRNLINQKAPQEEIDAIYNLILEKRAALSKKNKKELLKRTINHHMLVHRLVAIYFLPKPPADATYVAHLDYNKLNNKVENLKWMTHEEMQVHRANSPNIIAEKKARKLSAGKPHKNTKLTVTKVMLMKKLLNENKPIKQVAKIFKVTEMQVSRIKRGENWGAIESAK